MKLKVNTDKIRGSVPSFLLNNPYKYQKGGKASINKTLLKEIEEKHKTKSTKNEKKKDESRLFIEFMDTLPNKVKEHVEDLDETKVELIWESYGKPKTFKESLILHKPMFSRQSEDSDIPYKLNEQKPVISLNINNNNSFMRFISHQEGGVADESVTNEGKLVNSLLGKAKGQLNGKFSLEKWAIDTGILEPLSQTEKKKALQELGIPLTYTTKTDLDN